MAARAPAFVRALNSVDLPTLGKPTMPIFKFISVIITYFWYNWCMRKFKVSAIVRLGKRLFANAKASSLRKEVFVWIPRKAKAVILQ